MKKTKFLLVLIFLGLIISCGKKAGDRVVFGGLLGEADIININNLDCSVLINRGGKVAPPIQALKN